jgi:hypothetical protein
MAAVTHRVATASTSNTSSYASGAFTPAVGDLLVVFVHVTASVAAAPTMSTTGAAQSYSLATTKAVKASSADTLYCFVSNNFVTAASSQTVTFATSDAATSCFIQVFSVSGMSKSGLYAVRQMAKQDNGSAASAPTVTFPGVCLTGNVVAGAVANATSPAGLTPPASFTEGNDSTGVSTPTTGQEYAYRDSGHTSATVTWASNSASAFCALAVELDASAPAKTATLVDAFETGSLDAQWTNGGAATVSSGALHLPGIGYGTTYAVNSVADYDLTSSELVVEVSGVPGTHLVDGPFLTLELYYGNTPAPTNYYLRWFLYLSGSSEWSMAYKNTGTEVAVGSNQALGSGNRWLRIKHDGTNILWDTSPDGTTWSNRGSIAKATVGIPFSNLKVSMRAGADPSNSGNFDIGNVNTLGSTTHNAVAALAVTSTHVAAAEAVHEALAARSLRRRPAPAWRFTRGWPPERSLPPSLRRPPSPRRCTTRLRHWRSRLPGLPPRWPCTRPVPPSRSRLPLPPRRRVRRMRSGPLPSRAPLPPLPDAPRRRRAASPSPPPERPRRLARPMRRARWRSPRPSRLRPSLSGMQYRACRSRRQGQRLGS